jgi:N-methylhydantoinase B
MPPGGGGIGNPRDRDRALVAADLRDGLISIEAAQRIYGLEPERPAGPRRAPVPEVQHG